MPLIHPALLRPAVTAEHETTPDGAAPSEVPPSPVSRAGVVPQAGGAPADGAPADGGALLVPERFLVDEPMTLGLADLRELVSRLAGADLAWRPLVRHDPHSRWYTRLLLSGAVEVWLIGWYPGQRTEIHDHGGALGALAVAEGAVEEDECGPDWRIARTRRHGTGALATFRPDHVHRIVNRGNGLATTIHAYSPPELPLRYAPELGRRAEPGTAARAMAEAAPTPREAPALESRGVAAAAVPA
ncbi:cysteine dioxygenase [Parafrankia discariae]|uniref:cysteine dioxygenase n=1 Tax=Parafrankia discariae TaxID=365528 RepID=UPI0003AAF302|nr:cysteine dioxygenase family protein [Parafrankia discariae]